MADKPPVVYILFGEDEFTKAEFVTTLLGKMGDAVMAEMNTTRLDGRTAGFSDLENAVRVMPFLAPRRMVILASPVSMTKNLPLQKRFKEILDQIPETTALVLIE
ncbi:MAG: hypothetical protein V1791_09370, partial [Pseudomonadota bacterium]